MCINRIYCIYMCFSYTHMYLDVTSGTIPANQRRVRLLADPSTRCVRYSPHPPTPFPALYTSSTVLTERQRRLAPANFEQLR